MNKLQEKYQKLLSYLKELDSVAMPFLAEWILPFFLQPQKKH